MELITINNISIDLLSDNSSLVDSPLDSPVKINTDNLSRNYKNRTLLFHMPVYRMPIFHVPISETLFRVPMYRQLLNVLLSIEKPRNITVSETIKLKHKLDGNLGTGIIHQIENNINKYDYFVVLTSGVDSIGEEYLKEYFRKFRKPNKKLFIMFPKRFRPLNEALEDNGA